MVTIESVGHVAIRVKDLDASLAFYADKLGLPEMFRLNRDDRVWLVYLRITDDQYLEVFPEGEGDEAPGPMTVGQNHFCLTVADIDKAEAEVVALGIPFSSPKKQAADGNWQFWIKDPDGNRIEFMQMDPACKQLQAIRAMAGAG
ncbi:VOC family protein [Consotaella aegiceratis]|uniref:VOC family protein n=1 Tax=Consotaella aegiceratis TaxID=3097961 RepID=UPI002F404D6A